MISSNKESVVIHDTNWITLMLRQQFEMASVFDSSQILDLLVNDAFNLGYVFGFSDDASNFFHIEGNLKVKNAYILNTLSNLIGNESRGNTLVLYAQRQLKKPTFLRGYRKASKDMQDWLTAAGGTTPIGLSDHLEKTYLPPRGRLEQTCHKERCLERPT